MKPIEFEEQNAVFKGKGCLDLPVHKAENQIISCWKLTEDERKQIQETGIVWLSVMGQTQPPIWLGVDTPFVEDEKIEKEKG